MPDAQDDARFKELITKGERLTPYEKGELRAMRDNTRDPDLQAAINHVLGARPDEGGQGGGQYPILGGDR